MSSDFCIKCDKELSVYCGPCVDAIYAQRDAARAEKAVLLHRQDFKDFAEQAARFEQARQLADLLRSNPDFAAQVEALLAQGRK
jgi:predicted RNase H-like nuclease